MVVKYKVRVYYKNELLHTETLTESQFKKFIKRHFDRDTVYLSWSEDLSHVKPTHFTVEIVKKDDRTLKTFSDYLSHYSGELRTSTESGTWYTLTSTYRVWGID